MPAWNPAAASKYVLLIDAGIHRLHNLSSGHLDAEQDGARH